MMIKVRVFTGDDYELDKTITIPVSSLKIASKFMQSQASVLMEELGIDMVKFVELSREADIRGPLVEIEEHKKNKKLVISIE